MKKILIVFGIGLFGIMPTSCMAQAQFLPEFKIQLTSQKVISTSSLPKKPILLIYFSPDCDHCKVLIDQVFKKITEFKKVEILLVTFLPVKELFTFEKKYQLSKYSNIRAGTEMPVFFLRNNYKVLNTPFTALFDQDRKLIISYKEKTLVEDLIRHINKLS